MFGNVLNKWQVQSLMENEKKFTITDFNVAKFRLAHYPLTPGQASTVGELDARNRRKPNPPHNFNYDRTLTFQPSEYYLIEIDEFILLPEGISGHFVPSSSLITNGFGLHAGKIDPGYGQLKNKAQKLIFGVQNLLSTPNTFSADSPFVYMYLVDFRGLGNGEVKFDENEFKKFELWSRRYGRASDDGVQYDD